MTSLQVFILTFSKKLLFSNAKDSIFYNNYRMHNQFFLFFTYISIKEFMSQNVLYLKLIYSFTIFLQVLSWVYGTLFSLCLLGVSNIYNNFYEFRNLKIIFIIILQFWMDLTSEEKFKFANLIFNAQNITPTKQRFQQQLDEDERKKVIQLYSQKINSYVVNHHIKPPPQYGANEVRASTTPGFLSSVCCCFYPQQNRQNFDIISSLFIKRACSPFLFWSNTFFQIGEGKSEMYGPLWMTVAYIIILGIASNLNQNFIKPQNYKFNNDIVYQGLGVNVIFRLAQPLIYSAVIKCLGSMIQSPLSMMLTGYSLTLYMVPTILCFIPSLYWHLIMLIIAALLRTIFLLRNYSTRIESKAYLFLVVILLIEGLYLYIMLQTMFKNNSGYTIDDGTKQVFSHQMALRKFKE